MIKSCFSLEANEKKKKKKNARHKSEKLYSIQLIKIRENEF